MQQINWIAIMAVSFTVGLGVGCLVSPERRQAQTELASCEHHNQMACEVSVLAVPVPEL
jgi:hypothetical protein